MRNSGHMKPTAIVAMSLLLLSPIGLTAQWVPGSIYGRPGENTPEAATEVTIRIDGLLKGMSKNEILVATDEDHTTGLRRTSKTKFFRGRKEVKADDVAMDTKVSVEAAEDKDAKMMAVVVHLVDSPAATTPKKH